MIQKIIEFLGLFTLLLILVAVLRFFWFRLVIPPLL